MYKGYVKSKNVIGCIGVLRVIAAVEPEVPSLSGHRVSGFVLENGCGEFFTQ